MFNQLPPLPQLRRPGRRSGGCVGTGKNARFAQTIIFSVHFFGMNQGRYVGKRVPIIEIDSVVACGPGRKGEVIRTTVFC